MAMLILTGVDDASGARLYSPLDMARMHLSTDRKRAKRAGRPVVWMRV
jgi:hypothetical protein